MSPKPLPSRRPAVLTPAAARAGVMERPVTAPSAAGSLARCAWLRQRCLPRASGGSSSGGRGLFPRPRPGPLFRQRIQPPAPLRRAAAPEPEQGGAAGGEPATAPQLAAPAALGGPPSLPTPPAPGQATQSSADSLAEQLGKNPFVVLAVAAAVAVAELFRLLIWTPAKYMVLAPVRYLLSKVRCAPAQRAVPYVARACWAAAAGGCKPCQTPGARPCCHRSCHSLKRSVVHRAALGLCVE